MADIDADAIWALSDALAVEPTTEQKTASAIVSHIDNDGTIWVRLAGAENATPVNGGCVVEVEPNDAVTVRIENGRCAITGSTSKPATNSEAVESRVAPVEGAAMDAKSEATAARKIADEAASVAAATGQYFWHDENGAHVSIEAQNPTGASNSLWNSLGLLIRKAANNLVSITASAIAFFDGNGNADSNIVARFGADGAQIGKSSAAHSVIDADGQRFYASDGSTQLANIGYGVGAAQSGTATAPYYTFGTRAANSTIGNYSVAEGNETTASGYLAHSEGNETTASGAASHAEGWKTQATSSESHAQNYKTIAAKSAQTAIGTLNLEDTSSTTTHPSGLVGYGQYAFIIGNGRDNTSLGDQRSNAFMVDWQGDIYPQATKMNDFVVEQGTSGIWQYRKWNSGAAECWGIYTASIAITTSAAGYGGYRSAQITAPNFPFTFTATPAVTMTGGAGCNGCWINNINGTNGTRAQFYMSCGSSNAAANRGIHIQAMGKWK